MKTYVHVVDDALGALLLRYLFFIYILNGCVEEPPPEPDVKPPPQAPQRPNDTLDAGQLYGFFDAGSETPAVPGDTVTVPTDGGTPTSLWPVDPGDAIYDSGVSSGTEAVSILLGETRIRQLLSYQYHESIRQLLGEAAAAAVHLPEDTEIDNYRSFGSSQATWSSDNLSVFEENAFDAVEVAFLNHVGSANAQTPWLWCEPISLLDTQCMTEVVYRFGRRVFRRPLTESEMLRWRHVGMMAASEYGSYNLGIEFVMAGMLQSPYFLYVIEIGYPDPNEPDLRWLSPFELATRLSYFLTAGPPSEELLDAAQEGLLDTTAGIRNQAEILLETAGARMALREFFKERYTLTGALEKDTMVYPQFSEIIAEAMQEETLRLIEQVVWTDNVDFRTIFSAPYTFLNATLSSHYDLSDVHESETEWVRHDFSAADTRGGLLSQGSILSANATARRTSPTLRGKFIRQALLCQDIDPPPVGVNTNLPEIGDNEPHKTMRQRLDEHQADISCATCHASMDPLGLGLEHFNGVGQYRETDEGLTMDTTGVLFGQSFDGPKSLGVILQDREETALCLVRHLFRHLVGHKEVGDENAQLILLDYLFELDGYRLKDFLLSMVSTSLFRTIGTAAGMSHATTATSTPVIDGGLESEAP